MKNSVPLLLALSLASASAVLAEGAAPAAPPDPLDLKGAVTYALDHNYAILQAREQIRQQEGVIYQVQAAGIPNVSAVGGYQRNSPDISPSFPQEKSDWDV